MAATARLILPLPSSPQVGVLQIVGNAATIAHIVEAGVHIDSSGISRKLAAVQEVFRPDRVARWLKDAVMKTAAAEARKAAEGDAAAAAAAGAGAMKRSPLAGRHASVRIGLSHCHRAGIDAARSLRRPDAGAVRARDGRPRRAPAQRHDA